MLSIVFIVLFCFGIIFFIIDMIKLREHFLHLALFFIFGPFFIWFLSSIYIEDDFKSSINHYNIVNEKEMGNAEYNIYVCVLNKKIIESQMIIKEEFLFSFLPSIQELSTKDFLYLREIENDRL